LVFILKKDLSEPVQKAMHIDNTHLDIETLMQENALQLVYLDSHLTTAKLECINTEGWNNRYGSNCLKKQALS
jgi:hypothetical protein